MSKRTVKKNLNGIGTALPFVLPGLILVGIFVLYPMLFTIRISFSNYQIVQGTITFTGLDNFISIFTDTSGRFWYALRNNFLYAAITTPCIIMGGLVTAFLVNNLKKGQMVFRLGFYLPVITSWVIVGLVFKYMFNSSDRGLINYLLVDVFHLTDHYIPWLLQEWSGNAAIWIMGIWKNIGWAMLIFLAALQGISPNLYEAAKLDGANKFHEFRYITIPMVKATIFFVMVNMMIGSFNVFIQVMLLTEGKPNGRTSVLQYLLYDKAFKQFKFGEASSIGMFTAVTVLIITGVLNKIFHLEKTEEGES